MKTTLALLFLACFLTACKTDEPQPAVTAQAEPVQATVQAQPGKAAEPGAKYHRMRLAPLTRDQSPGAKKG